ncbi:MAG: 2-amino-4-hydroxy-6-hydroxymethyldihydropteridine diphosphokinase [Hyphomicrobiaceae bacterium]|nr:2-amino-4-hydroxy-6-hydroxymethyldihydropteridine diphosphokinase [Hyphomicrobiaceae bacterium]
MPVGDALVALGSNIGDKAANVRQALALLTQEGDIRLLASSRIFKTPPWGKTDQDWFVNAAARVGTSLSPHQLLGRCLAIERAMGRERGEKWGPRVIDLDVLAHGPTRISDKDLTLPHPYITERAFVLAPLSDVAPEFVIKGRTVDQWLAAIDRSGVEPM